MSNQPAINLDQLLMTGAAAARGGNRAAARAIFLALGREHPNDPRVWLGLAAVALDDGEQRMALEQALTLDPDNERARQALRRLANAPPAPATPAPPASAPLATPPLTDAAPERATPRPAQPPDDADETDQTHAPFPLLNLFALLLILLLLGAVGITIGRNLLGAPGGATAPSATPILAVIPGSSSLPTIIPSATTGASATTAPIIAPALPTATSETIGPALPVTSTAAPATTPPAAATGAPEPSASAALPLGQIIDYDGWSATLLRPDYAVALDGAIGDLQPAGRFVLAVVAVSNNGPSPRPIPPSLFTLSDSAGRSYAPIPGASTAYLALYERGQRGDLALEDPLDPDSGMRSVPILFDIPRDATGLRLIMAGAAGAGWPIGGDAPTTVGP